MSVPVLSVEQVAFAYPGGPPVLDGLDLTLVPGELVALLGASGSGKSTLLSLAGLLLAPSAGEIRLDGAPTRSLPEAGRERLRSASLGFVFQFHFLLPDFTAAENIAMPLWVQARRRTAEGLRQARDLLARLELAHLGDRLPSQLSGGERQRVAIARAIVHKPILILADEPTGALDSHSGEQVLRLLLDVRRETGCSALIATHNPLLATQLDRVVRVQDGRIVAGPMPSAPPPEPA